MHFLFSIYKRLHSFLSWKVWSKMWIPPPTPLIGKYFAAVLDNDLKCDTVPWWWGWFKRTKWLCDLLVFASSSVCCFKFGPLMFNLFCLYCLLFDALSLVPLCLTSFACTAYFLMLWVWSLSVQPLACTAYLVSFSLRVFLQVFKVQSLVDGYMNCYRNCKVHSSLLVRCFRCLHIALKWMNMFNTHS